MSPQRYFELLARYNQWMNTKIYDASSQLDATVLHSDKGAFFGSIFGTLNHLMVADTIWITRFALHPGQFSALASAASLPMPKALNQHLYADLPSLRDARQHMDAMIIQFVDETSDSHYDQPLHYFNTRGEAFMRPLGPLMQHFFNHQTHHRGQITTLLTQSGVDVGVTDMSALLSDGQAV